MNDFFCGQFLPSAQDGFGIFDKWFAFVPSHSLTIVESAEESGEKSPGNIHQSEVLLCDTQTDKHTIMENKQIRLGFFLTYD